MCMLIVANLEWKVLFCRYTFHIYLWRYQIKLKPKDDRKTKFTFYNKIDFLANLTVRGNSLSATSETVRWILAIHLAKYSFLVNAWD